MNHANLVIKQHKSRIWYLGVGFTLFVAFVVIFIIGRYLAITDLNVTKSELIKSKQALSKTQEMLNSVSESLVMQKQSSEVDNMSNRELVSSVKDMQQAQNELREELKFYRSIMAPERDIDGLEIDSVVISSTDKLGEFHFRVTLIQAGKQTQYLKGEIVLRVSGLLNGKSKQYRFRELGTFNNKQFQFKFKYFQNIQGFINLPAEFEAKEVNVMAQTKGMRKYQKTDKTAVWQLKEK